MASSEEEMDIEEDEDDLDEDEAEIVSQKAYSSLLPEVREELGDEKPNLLKDKQERVCLVCPTVQRFKGWRALMAHARTFTKKRVLRHRGYFKALEEVITPNAEQRDKVDIQATRIVPARASTSDIASSARIEQKVNEEEMEALRKEKLRLWELSERKNEIEHRRTVLQVQMERDRHDLEELKRSGERESQRREEEAKRETMSFKREMKELDARWEERRRRLEMKLKKRKTDSEIMERLQHLQELKKLVEKGTETAKQQSQKLLELEEEKNKIENNLAVMTQELNEAFQSEELRLKEKHKKEIMEMEEQLDKEVNQLVAEWQEKKSTEQAEDEAKKKEEVVENECVVCWDTLDDKRALLRPCGHAKTCITCAKELFKKKKGCPLCRSVMNSKPVLLPKCD